MTELSSTDPITTCERILRENEFQNRELELLRSENEVIAHMLGRQLELADAYRELHYKLAPYPPALEVFFRAFISTAAFWNPKRVAEARDGRRRLEMVNDLIADKATQLADLLQEREALHNDSGFASNTHYHVCRVIEDAARDIHLYNSWVRDRLRNLRQQFDLKYWPRMHDFVNELARDASDATLEATDSITAAATTGPRGSRADFFKALIAAMEENGAAEGGFLPIGFKLSDDCLASLANCALNLDEQELVDGAYVKRLRQRRRNGSLRGPGADVEDGAVSWQ